MEKPQVLLVGLGQVGVGYDLGAPTNQVLSHARALTTHPRVELLGGVDTSSTNRARFGAEYELPVYGHVRGAVAQHQPDVVVVATPTNQHGSVISQILSECEPRLILCEKPLSSSVNEALEIAELASSAGVDMRVNYMRRADPTIQDLRRSIREQEFGKLERAVCVYTGGVFHNGTHFIDLLSYWLGSPITAPRGDDLSEFLEFEDQPLSFSLDFELGEASFIGLSSALYSPACLSLWFTSARLDYDWGGKLIDLCDLSELHLPSALPKEMRFKSHLPRIQSHVVDEVVKILDGRTSSLCTAREAVQNLLVVTEVLMARSGAHAK
jgi:hypothetical protein